MTDATLTIILSYVPSIVAAIGGVAATVISAFALRKGTENGEKADKARETTDEIAVKTDEIHRLADGKLSRITEQLRAANENIASLQGLDESKLIGVLESHQAVLTRLDSDVAQLSEKVDTVRERQHDFANFLQQMGMKFQLRPLPEFKRETNNPPGGKT